MDSSRSAEKSRLRSRRIHPDFKVDDLRFNLEFQETKSSPSRVGSTKNTPELETNPKHWAIVSEGFPPGVTVDELKKYGRRKQLTHLRPQDNLRLEEGSLRLYKSEYKHRFLAYGLPKVSLTSEEKKTFEDGNSCVYYSLRGPLLRPQNNLFLLKDQPMESMTEKKSKYIPFPNYEKRKLLRRSTALRPEGEIARETEVRKEYVDHKNPERVRLIRNLPSLRLEGNQEPLMTEQRDKFIAYLLGRRPVLEKKKSSLKMEGNFDFATEKNRSYVPHEFSERPRIRKRSTSLKLEGEVEFSPEYRISFVNFPRSRPVTYKPLEKLRHEGELENLTETKTQFVNYENVEIPGSAKPENNLHVEGEMEINPEYRINFVDFPRERPIPRKPFNQLKPEGNLQVLRGSLEKPSGVEEVRVDSLQRPSDLGMDKELSYLLENTGKLEEGEIPNEVGTPKENPDGAAEKDDVLPSSVPARGAGPGKSKREFLFCPEFTKYYARDERGLNANSTKEIKSNLSFPRKKGQKDKFKTSFEDEKKSGSETLHGKSSVKRLKEAAATEKIQSEIFKEKSGKFEEGRKRDVLVRQNLRFMEVPPKDAPLTSKEFPAFKVLDVKGQMGCQSLVNDILESEKSTSDEENSTYRLEVFNSENRSPGFFRNGRRIFPHMALEQKQKVGNYVKIVKSPEIPNCLLEGDGEAERRKWRVSEKLYPFSAENPAEPSFVVLEQDGLVGTESPGASGEVTGKDKEGCTLPRCNSPLP